MNGIGGISAGAVLSAFLANGLQADSLSKLLSDNVAASLTFDRLIMGFMGLGLIVGVAALGVITARAVVERRQQIGVLRAIGFRRGMVQLSFLIESSFMFSSFLLKPLVKRVNLRLDMRMVRFLGLSKCVCNRVILR